MCHVTRQREGGTWWWFVTFVVLLGGSMLTARVTWAQADQPDEARVEPVMVTAPRVAIPITKVPAAISVVDQTDVQLGQPTIGLDESIVRIPGIFPQNRFNFAQDLRLSIRGFGARAAFGIRGIKILVDGIPETLPDGQSQVDSIDLGSAQSVEVMRGPASALYGNAAGGVISIHTEDGPPRPVVEARTTHGEFGLWKMQLKSGGQAGPLNYLANISRLELGGYRDQSRTENVVFNSKIRLDIDASSDLTAVINVLDSPRADDPGGLTAEEVDADRRQAGPNNLRFDTGEEVSQQRFGLIYRREFAALHDLHVTGFFTARQFRNSIPFTVVEFDRYFIGGGIQYSYRGALFGRPNRLTVGIDVQYQADRRKNFNNVAGEPGEDLDLNQDEQVTSIGPYIQEEFSILDNLSLVLGGRYDNVRFKVNDFFTSDGDDDSGSRTFDQLTGRGGLLYSPIPEVNLYVNVAQSFETPTTTELVNRRDASGGLNPDIDPQKATNYEIGVKGQALGRLAYELALFYIFIRDELVPSVENGRTFFDNAGKSRRYGVEFALAMEVITGLRASVAYTYLDTEFRDFEIGNDDFEGNDVPGLPKHQVHGEALYRHPWGFYGGIDVFYVSDFFVNNANTVKNEAYTVANLRLGYEHDFGHWRLAPFFGIQNLFDETYNANVRINDANNRFFEPAPTLNLYGGLMVAYHW